jgi:hypothetical protein
MKCEMLSRVLQRGKFHHAFRLLDTYAVLKQFMDFIICLNFFYNYNSNENKLLKLNFAQRNSE